MSGLVVVCFLIAAIFIYIGSRPLPSTPLPASPQTKSANGRILSPDEQRALRVPLQSASAEEKQQHAQTLATLVKTAPVLDITGCRPEPIVYQADLNGSFQVRNNDTVAHKLRYGSLMVAIPPQATTTVQTSQLFKTAKDYGYGCDNPFAQHGIMMVR